MEHPRRKNVGKRRPPYPAGLTPIGSNRVYRRVGSGRVAEMPDPQTPTVVDH